MNHANRFTGWKILGLGLVLLGGCSKSDSGAAGPTPGGTRARIGVSIPSGDHGWTAGVVWWAQRAMALHPEIDWQFAAAENGQKQVADIETMMAKGLDGLVVLPTEVEPVTQACKAAHQRGIYIVNVDRGLTEPIADMHLEGDNKLFGRKSAEYVVDKMNHKGNLVILEGQINQVNSDRVDAAKAVFAQYPDIHILADQEADWNREQGLKVMQGVLATNPHIDAVWAQDDDTALGAIAAIKEAGRQKEMWVLGGAGMKQVVEMVMNRDPMVPADITYPPSMIAAGIHLAASALRDGRQAQLSQFMPRHLIQDVDLVTPENAQQFYFKDSVY
jgi:ribose transport system substrate-binding protein